MDETAPSPEFFNHLLNENQAIITLIGTSGSGKSEIAKKLVEAGNKKESFLNPLTGKKMIINFDASHIDLEITRKLRPRIIHDNLDFLSNRIGKEDLESLRQTLEKSSMNEEDSQDLNFVSFWMKTVMHCRKWYDYTAFYYNKAEEEATGSFNNSLEYTIK